MAYKPKSYRRVQFTVRGTGSFPLDMLRYDQCHVAHPRSQELIDEATWRSKEYEVQLESYRPSWNRQDLIKAKLYPTFERWKSFGWHVVEGSVEMIRVPIADIPSEHRPPQQ